MIGWSVHYICTVTYVSGWCSVTRSLMQQSLPSASWLLRLRNSRMRSRGCGSRDYVTWCGGSTQELWRAENSPETAANLSSVTLWLHHGHIWGWRRKLRLQFYQYPLIATLQGNCLCYVYNKTIRYKIIVIICMEITTMHVYVYMHIQCNRYI